MNHDIAVLNHRVTSSLLSVNKVQLSMAFESSGMKVTDFSEVVLVPVLDAIGDRGQSGELSLSQVYMSGRLCEKFLEELSPSDSSTLKAPGIAVAILEDFHVLGKRIVCSVLRAAGYDFIDYGPIALEELLERVQADQIRILLVSTLMLDSALKVKKIKEFLVARNLDMKLIVGGAPFRFDPTLWQEVGADATSATASGVASLIQNLTQKEAAHGNL